MMPKSKSKRGIDKKKIKRGTSAIPPKTIKIPPADQDLVKKVEFVDVAKLRSHPRNYREHPEDQVDHLVQSIRDNGFYRNVVVTRDDVILAGHGVVKAAAKIGVERVPVIRLDIDSNDERALKILVGDNEVARLAMVDDRALTELLKEIKDFDVNALLGTGFDEKMLAGLLYVTRPASEIGNLDEAAHWAGMTEYSDSEEPLKLIVNFRSEADREAFAGQFGLKILKKEARSWTTWWPEKEIDDASSVKFVG